MSVFFVLGESGITFSSPRSIKVSKSSRLRGVHGSGGFVVGNDRVIVINVRF